MLKLTFLVLLAMVAVASAALCCQQNENRGPINKATNSKLTQAPKATPEVSIKQMVLVLKVTKDEDQSLILDWKSSNGLDWKFVTMEFVNEEGCVMKEVWAHKSLVFRYSPFLRNLSASLAYLGNKKKNYYTMNYPVQIIESLVNLMYEHKVTINASDYNVIMAAARTIQIDKWIGTAEGNNESVLAKQK